MCLRRFPFVLCEPRVNLSTELPFDIRQVANFHARAEEAEESPPLRVSGVPPPDGPAAAAAERDIETNGRAVPPNVDPFREPSDLFLIVAFDSFGKVENSRLPVSRLPSHRRWRHFLNKSLRARKWRIRQEAGLATGLLTQQLDAIRRAL